MIERLVGAVVALASAALLVAGLVTSAWWVGETGAGAHGGARDRHIGLRSEEQCFITHEAGGKPRCTATTTTDCDSSASESCQSAGTLKHDTIFGAAGWLATVMGAVAALLLLVAGGTSLARGREEARGSAGAATVLAVIAAVAGLAFVLLRPGLADFDGGVGWSAYAFFAGGAAAVIAGAVVRREAQVAAAAPVVSAARFNPFSDPIAPASKVRGADIDVAALFAEDEAKARAAADAKKAEDKALDVKLAARAASEAIAALDEPSNAAPIPAAPPAPAPPPAPVAKVAPKIPPPPVPEPRADTEKDLPPDDMQGTPAPAAEPPVAAASPPAPARSKPSSLPPLPLPRTKPPSLSPPSKPPATASGTGAAPRITPPAPSPAAVPAPPAIAVNSAGPVPACPQCDAPTIWNEEHLRFFCRKCRIYL